MAVRVSAILNFYIHRRYLEDALRSIASQESARPLDVVILSPEPNIEISPRVEQLAAEQGHDLRVVPIPSVPAGAGLKIGATAARGDYLAILDDDDLWEPGKVRWIEIACEQLPEVGYLHNSQRFVDSANRPLSPLNPHRLVRHPSSLLPEGRSLAVDTHDVRSIARSMAFAPDFNNSSCVIDRSVLVGASPAIEMVTRGEDSFLFYVALLSGRPMFLTSNRYTRYRLHSAASTAAEPSAGVGAARLSGYISYADDHIAMLDLIRRHLILQVTSPAVREWLAHDIAFWSVLRGVASAQLHSQSGVDTLRELLGGTRVRPRSREVYAAIWGVASFLAPRFTQSAFVGWRHVW